MAKDLSGYTDEELLAIAGEQKPWYSQVAGYAGDAATRYARGLNRAALGLMTLPAEVAALPYNLAMTATGGEPIRPTQSAAQFLGVQPRQRGDVAGVLGEGSIGGLFGGVPGAVVGGGINLGAYTGAQMIPSSEEAKPYIEAGLSLIPGMVATGLATRASRVGKNTPMASEGETGITLTPGQRSGTERQLVREADVGSTVEGATAFRQLEAAQQAQLKTYLDDIQRFTSDPTLSSTEIRSNVVNLANKQSNSIVNRFRAQNRVNFDKARQAAGDSRIINTDNAVKRIDALLEKYDRPESGFQDVVAPLKQLRSALVIEGKPAQTIASKVVDAQGNPVSVQKIPATSATNKKLTISELQQQLEVLGQAAKAGTSKTPGVKTNPFSGITPGTARHISREVLDGFRADLDAASKQNIPGAKELQFARDSFKSGLKQINDFASRPLMKKLNVQTEEALTPEAIVDGLVKAKPTERKAILELVQQAKPEVYQSLRYRAMNNLFGKAETPEQMAAALKKFRDDVKSNALGKTEDGIPLDDFLFPTPAEKLKFNAFTRDLELIQRKASSGESSLPGMKAAVSGGASVIGGAPGRYLANTAMALWQMIANTSDNAKLALAFTNPEARSAIAALGKMRANQQVPQDILDKLAPFTQFKKTIAKASPVVGASRIGSGQLEQTQVPIDLSGYTDEELQQIMGAQQ